MGFAGKGLDTLYILNGTIISYVKLKVQYYCNYQEQTLLYGSKFVCYLSMLFTFKR
jgi:hypothetical protein